MIGNIIYTSKCKIPKCKRTMYFFQPRKLNNNIELLKNKHDSNQFFFFEHVFFPTFGGCSWSFLEGFLTLSRYGKKLVFGEGGHSIEGVSHRSYTVAIFFHFQNCISLDRFK